MNTADSENNSHRQEACKTFIEQIKLLTSLASAFIIAPAIVPNIMEFVLGWPIIVAEMLFVVSIVAGYVALGAIAGTQHTGEYNVYRPAARFGGLIQFITYLGGIGFFGYWFITSYSSAVTGTS